jgi:hypothetical protein
MDEAQRMGEEGELRVRRMQQGYDTGIDGDASKLWLQIGRAGG